MTTAPNELVPSLPTEFGRVLRRREGSIGFHCDVIAAGPGHPRESERVIFDVLQRRHAAQPYDWVFMGYDASQKQGEFALEGKELALEPYRDWPDPKITADIAESFVRDGRVASAWAFGLVAQPVCRLVPLDDWYGWAVSRDALRQLDAAAGRLAMAAALLERTAEDSSACADPVRQLFDLVRLRWTGDQWQDDKDKVLGVDIEGLLVTRRVDGAKPLATFLSKLRVLAADFYIASLRRTDAMVAAAVERMRKTGARRGAILVAFPWMGQAEAALGAAAVGFDAILPAKVGMGAMLDHARGLLGIHEEKDRPLNELFSGERARTRIEALLEDRPDLAQARAQDWAAAAQGLATRYEMRFDRLDLKRAEECVDRALALHEANDHSWWIKGELLNLERRHKDALGALERAIAIAPRNAQYWRAKGTALDGLGDARGARRHFVRAIHVSPREGSLWTFLGLHYHGQHRHAAACYCLGKGKEHGDDAARANHQTLGCSEPRLRHCPLVLLPLVIRAMNRVVLPLRYDWGEARLNAGLLAAAALLVVAAISGAIVGALAGGVWGGIVGFVVFLLAGALAGGLLFFASAAASGLGLGRWKAAVVFAMAGLGAWLGAMEGGGLGRGTWQPIWAGAGRIATGAFGAVVGALVGGVVLSRRSARPTEAYPLSNESQAPHRTTSGRPIPEPVTYTSCVEVVELGLHVYQLRTIIHALLEVVFDCMADPKLMAELLPVARRTVHGAESVAVGARWRVAHWLGPIPRHTNYEVVAYDRPRYFRRVLTGATRCEVEYHFESQDAGTLVVCRLSVGHRWLERSFVDAQRRFLFALKQALEERHGSVGVSMSNLDAMRGAQGDRVRTWSSLVLWLASLIAVFAMWNLLKL